MYWYWLEFLFNQHTLSIYRSSSKILLFIIKKELVAEITQLEKERDELEAKLKKVNG